MRTLEQDYDFGPDPRDAALDAEELAQLLAEEDQ